MANRVDELLAEVKKIQSTCQHMFIPPKNIVHKSKIAGVYLVSVKGDEISFGAKCSECSVVKNFSAAEVCVMCFGRMIKGTLGDREIFFPDGAYIYYAARRLNCENGDFHAVVDEWDQ